MWHLDYKESWVPKNWCFWTVVLEKTLESPLDSKEIQPVHPKGNQSWLFIERTDAETPIFWPPDVKKWLLREDWRCWERLKARGERDDRMRWLDCITNWMETRLSKLQGVGDGQGGLACCSPWGCKELDTTEWRNWTDELLGSATHVPGIYWLLWHDQGRLWYSGLLVGIWSCRGSPEDVSLCCSSGWSYFHPSWVFIAKKLKTFK